MIQYKHMAKTTKPKKTVTNEETPVDTSVETTETVEESTVAMADASMANDFHKVGIYVNGALFKVFNSVNHGLEFKELAASYAARHLEKNPGSRVSVEPIIDITEDTPEVDTVKVLNGSNSVVRTFSKATHGADYRELATAFVDKYGAKRGYRLV